MDKLTKLAAAVTALVVAVGTLVAALGLGAKPASTDTLIILDSPAAYQAFLEGHPG